MVALATLNSIPIPYEAVPLVSILPELVLLMVALVPEEYIPNAPMPVVVMVPELVMVALAPVDEIPSPGAEWLVCPLKSGPP